MRHSRSKAWTIAAAFICTAASAQTVIRDPVFKASERLEAERKAEAERIAVAKRVEQNQAEKKTKGTSEAGKALEAALAGQRYAIPAKAMDARERLLKRCLRVYTDDTTAHRHFFGVSFWKQPSWHILGTAGECDGKRVADDVRREEKVIYTAPDMEAFATEARYIGSAQHLTWDVTKPNGAALDDKEAKEIQDDADAFAMLWVSSRPLDTLFPVHDDYTSRAFFGDARLSFLHSVQASGWLDRIAFNTELVSDRIGWGRLALIAAFAGTKPNEQPTTDADRAKDNLQKFLTQGGDVGITFELPLLYAETPGIPGFVVLEAYPRFVTAIPGLSSTQNDVSGAFEPGGRLHLRIRGWDHTISPYGEVWGAWVMGMGQDWQKYVNVQGNFGVLVANAGLTISDKYNIGGSYIIGGPLRGQNGVSISVSVLTGE
ncbi:MAG: hypothetical protein ACM3SX_17335 [Deltaproteobacteria bacterium]